MKGPFEGRVALVTGAGSGIGRTTALSFATEGAKVVVSDIVAKKAEETVSLIKNAGGAAISIKTDVTQSVEVESAIHKTVQNYGRLDFACNSAGIEGDLTLTAEYSEKTCDLILSVNLKGVWLCMKHEILQMLKQGSGAIVNISSTSGIVGTTNSIYCASKHGVVGLTKSAALEYAKSGIRVNAVCPGAVNTPMFATLTADNPEVSEKAVACHPLGRMADPEEIAAAVLWLCSEASSFVTGHSLLVDGGYSIGQSLSVE